MRDAISSMLVKAIRTSTLPYQVAARAMAGPTVIEPPLQCKVTMGRNDIATTVQL